LRGRPRRSSKKKIRQPSLFSSYGSQNSERFEGFLVFSGATGQLLRWNVECCEWIVEFISVSDETVSQQ